MALVQSKKNTSKSIYKLLPFNFIDLDNKREILVSEAGDYIIVPKGTSRKVVNREIHIGSSLYKDLLANNIIVESYSSGHLDVLANRVRTKRSNLSQDSSLHIFVVSLRCNHTCHYCQVSRVSEDRDEFDLSIINIEKAVDIMLSSNTRYITMEFQGGEPLLNFDTIKHAVDLTERKKESKKINYVICTNATVYNDEIINFCKEYDVLISTSLDGPKELHDSNRKKPKSSSYDEVIRGIKYFQNELGDEKVSALMTTSVKSLNYSKEIIDEYRKLGFHSIFLRPISPYGFALRNQKKNYYDTENFLDFYKNSLEYIIQLNQAGEFFREDYTSILLSKIITPFTTSYVDLISPAGAINSVLVYNYDGSIYASDEARMLAENEDYTFRLGHVDEGLNILRSKSAIEIYDNSLNECIAGCSECAFQLYCGADPIYNYSTQGDIYGNRANSNFCRRNMAIIKHIINLYESDQEIKNIFLSWIKRES